jgi:high-affinity nickel-transport protein
VGLRPPGAQGVLQPDDHQYLGRRGLVIGSIELISVLADRFDITTGPLAAIANINLDYAGYAIAGLFVVSWLVALPIWRFGRIEERWSSDLAG